MKWVSRDKLTAHDNNIYAYSSVVLYCSKNPEKSLITMNIMNVRDGIVICSLDAVTLLQKSPRQTKIIKNSNSHVLSAGSKQELRYQARICLKSSQVNCPLISMQQGQSAHMPKKVRPMGYFRIMRHHRACSSSITSHSASVINGMHQDASANRNELRHWESKTLFWGFYSLYTFL